MKFADGFWLNQRGYTVDYAVQPYDVQVKNNAVHVFATSSHIFHRGMTLGGVTFEIVYASTLENTIKVSIVHHKGVVDHAPKFELNENFQFIPKISETDDAVTLQSGKTSVRIQKGKDWNVTFSYENKHLTGCGWRSTSYIQEDAATTQNRLNAKANDSFWSIPADKRSSFLREQLTLSVGEYLYGFGEKFTPFVKNGQSIDIWNSDGGTCSDQSYKCVPFYLSSRGYGVFTNHTGYVSYEAASDTVSKISTTVFGESLEYFIIGGENCADVLSTYTTLTGKPALPPAKTMGLWLSTSFTTDYDEQTVTSFIDGMTERKIPLQMFHFDCFWMKGYTWTSFSWDKTQFPDPQGMLSRLKHEKNIGICVWINPYISQQSALFDDGLEKGYFIHMQDGGIFQTDMWQPGMAIVDFTNPEACKWFADGIRTLCAQGVTAIKTDFGERIPTNVVYFDGSDPLAMHNYYTYLYNKVVFEALESCMGKDNTCLFARSATAGGQKFPVHWGGDCAAEYSAMAETLRGGLSLCASGFGFFSHDIGGFEQTASPDVYKRWCAFGLMSTHSRLHGSTSYRVPWAYEEDDPANPENACAVLRHFTKLKGKLMPYLWAEANHTHETGVPMMRAMVIDFADDPACRTLDRQYMLGEKLLCAPVFDPSGEVEFYLPNGKWFDLLSKPDSKLIEGGRWLHRTCNYLQMPIYVKPNSIIGLGNFQTDVVYDYLDGTTFLICGLEDGHIASCDIYRAEGGKEMTITAKREGQQITVEYPATNKQFQFCIAGTNILMNAQKNGITKISL